MLIDNVPQHLFEIWRHFDEGRWHLPAHQRKLVWDQLKIKNWFRTLEKIHEIGGGSVEGVIIIYQLDGESKIYLNDGAQRVYWTIKKFVEHCKEEGKPWKEILSSVKITVQRVAYGSIGEAIKGFIQINFGTTATPYELARTLMCELLPNFSETWEPRLRKVQDIVRTALLRVNAVVEDRDDPKKRDLSHKRIRDEMHLFWKFISEDNTLFSPQVALSNLRPDQWDKHTKLERSLAEELLSLGIDGTDEKIVAFERFINERVAFYLQIWAEQQAVAIRPANVHFRWWLACTIYFKNNSLPPAMVREFTEKLIKHSDGRTSIFYSSEESGKNCNCNTAMAMYRQLGMIAKIIGCDFSIKKERRRKPKTALKKGFVNSHLNSFAVYGEGETVAENAIENRHRSARDMTGDEKQRLFNFNKSSDL